MSGRRVRSAAYRARRLERRIARNLRRSLKAARAAGVDIHAV